MRIGFCGAHRTGKSTLSKAVAERLDLDLTPNPNTAKARGFDMKNNHRFTPEGQALQNAILDSMLERLVGDRFVADRTPIDAAAYLLADATADRGGESDWEASLIYMDNAIKQTFRRFDLVVLVPPALPVEPDPDKPPVNSAYQQHIHLLCRSMLLEREEWLMPAVELPVETLSLKTRVQFVLDHIREAARMRSIRMATKTTRIFD
jgi:nicotinamide riboside kinase